MMHHSMLCASQPRLSSFLSSSFLWSKKTHRTTGVSERTRASHIACTLRTHLGDGERLRLLLELLLLLLLLLEELDELEPDRDFAIVAYPCV